MKLSYKSRLLVSILFVAIIIVLGGAGVVYWLGEYDEDKAATGHGPPAANSGASAPSLEPFPNSPSNGTPRTAHAADQVFPFRRVVAIVIGINNYPNLTGTPNLAYAQADATAVGDLFDSHYGYEVIRLLGPEATKASIEATILKYSKELGDRDALIVYFAGHGQVIELVGHGEAGFLIPADARLDIRDGRDLPLWVDQAIDMKELTTQLDESTTQHVVLIADACCSGYLTARGSLERWDFRNFLTDKSRTVLTATNRRQQARESPERNHGVFTAALLEQLKRKDAASVLDIYYPLSHQIPKCVNGNMQPQFAQFGDGNGMFVFLPLSISKEEIANDLTIENIKGESSRTHGLKGVYNRSAKLGKQMTTYPEFLAALAATDYRFAVNAEDLRKEWEQKFARFQRNALLGDIWAMAALCCCYEKSLGVEKDQNQVVYWARQVDRMQNAAGVGQFLLGTCYKKGFIPINSKARAKEQADRLFAESAAKGFGPGRHAYAGVLYSDKISPVQRQVVHEHLETAAADGVLLANVELGLLLLEECKQSGDREKTQRAIGLLETAADKGLANAGYILSKLLAGRSLIGDFRHIPRDFKKSRELLQTAFERGYSLAIVDLGFLHLDGHRDLGITRDFSRAFELFEQAGELGEAAALGMSARMLADGIGVKKDEQKARTRLEAAVKLDVAEADFVQGDWYVSGKVYRQSDEEAYGAFLRGAEKGHPGCCYWAGQMCLAGMGFKVKGALRKNALHDDWHRGLHYLVLAHQSNQASEPEMKQIEKTLKSFVDLLEGGELSKKIDSHIKDKPRGPNDNTIQSQNGNKSGERGQRRKMEFRMGMLAEILEGDYITRATSIASFWREQYPNTFQYFCEKWGVDPKSLEVKAQVK